MSMNDSDPTLNKYKSSTGNKVNRSRLPFTAPTNIIDGKENWSFKDKVRREFRENFRLTDGILVIIVAIISGYLVKKIFIGHSQNPIKKYLGEMFLVGVTGFVANHPDEVKIVHNTLNLWIHKMRGDCSTKI